MAEAGRGSEFWESKVEVRIRESQKYLRSFQDSWPAYENYSRALLTLGERQTSVIQESQWSSNMGTHIKLMNALKVQIRDSNILNITKSSDDFWN